MNLVLGGGGALNSRLGTVIRDELGLAYTVESYFDAGWYPGPFGVALGTNPANARKAIETMLREVTRLRDRGITRRERDEAVAYLTGRFPLRLETNIGMADVLWAMEFYRLGPDYLDRYADHYRAVTVDPGERRRREAPPPRPRNPGRVGYGSRRRRPVRSSAPSGASVA